MYGFSEKGEYFLDLPHQYFDAILDPFEQFPDSGNDFLHSLDDNILYFFKKQFHRTEQILPPARLYFSAALGFTSIVVVLLVAIVIFDDVIQF